MKKMLILFVCLVFTASVFADDNDVVWNGGIGDWMEPLNWTDDPVAPDWDIPGWVVDNPENTGSSTDSSWNQGVAVIGSGTAKITSTSNPDGNIQEIKVGGGSGASLEIGADITVNNNIWGAVNSVSETSSITQTAGNVTIDSRLYVGLRGNGTYTLSGGSLDVAGICHLGGVYDGSSGVYTQTGGSFTKSTDRVWVGLQSGSSGIMNLSGGTFYQGGTFDFYVAQDAGSSGTINLSDTGSLTQTGTSFLLGDAGVGDMNQTGGSFDVQRFILGDETTGSGDYTISGGSCYADRYIYLDNNATFTVEGSGATSISTYKFIMNDETLHISLDANGSTLIEAFGTESDGGYNGAVLTNGTLAIDTLVDFDGVVGSTYDILWAATYIDDTGLSLTNLSSTPFSYSILDATQYGYSSGQLLRLAVVPEPSPAQALVDINDTVVFVVSAPGVTSYSWYRSLDPNNNTSGDDVSVGMDSNTLTLANIQSSDEGYYYCVLTGYNGDTVSGISWLMTKRAVSQWQFENNLNDSIDGYNGISTNTPVYPTGMIGVNALEFSNDVNDVVVVSHEPKLNISSFTISAWAKPVVDSNDISRVVACSRNTNAGYVLYARSTGEWAFTVLGSDGSHLVLGSDVVEDEWSLLTATFEQTDVLGDDLVGTSSIYINGKFVGSLSNVKYQPDVSSAGFYVGSDWSVSSGNFNPFYGSIDDVRYYSYALDSRQVAQLYANGTDQPVCVPEYGHDYNEDCKVDHEDLAELLLEWLNDSFVYPSGM